jgi:hypothetical protein
LSDILHRLCAAGAIAEIARVGHAPFGEDDPIEIRFAGGAVFNINVQAMDATDLEIGEGGYLDSAFGHLRQEEPATFAGIERDWTSEPLDLPWAIGQMLSAPRRLTMTQPYRVDVGYVFACGGRELALFGESDLIFAVALDDPDLSDFTLEVGAAL